MLILVLFSISRFVLLIQLKWNRTALGMANAIRTMLKSTDASVMQAGKDILNAPWKQQKCQKYLDRHRYLWKKLHSSFNSN